MGVTWATGSSLHVRSITALVHWPQFACRGSGAGMDESEVFVPGAIDETSTETLSEATRHPVVRRANVVMRIAAGTAVVFAALVPIAALVFFMLHIFNGLTFTQLT